MTRWEFDDWMDLHTSHFPGLAIWLEKMDEAQRKGVMAVWLETLSPHTRDDALKATKKLFAMNPRKLFYEHHPQVLRSIIEEIEVARRAEEDGGDSKRLREEGDRWRAEMEANPWEPILPEIKRVMGGEGVPSEEEVPF